MPIYEFQCKKGHITEKLWSVREREVRRIPCPFPYDGSITLVVGTHDDICGLEALKIVSMPANLNTPDDSKNNFVYFENPKTGEVTFNSLNDGWQPHGFVKREARNHFERLAVESKIRKQSDAKLSESYERDDMRRHFSEGARHSELNAAISQGAIAVENPETGNKETVYLDDRTKGLLKKGMQHSINKKPRRKQSDFRLAANHSDSSNLKNQE